MKKILILGGTKFMGRLMVEKLEKMPDFDITLFNRQKLNPGLFPDVKKIKGDIDTDDIDQITKKDWDVIVDFCTYYPLSLERLIKSLKGKVGRYVFISTCSVYDLEKYVNQMVDENAEIYSCNDEQKINPSMEAYGPRKAECDRILLNTDWLDKLILRPSLVYGKYDTSDRFYYWIHRIKTQKKIIFPGDAIEKENFTFAEDMAELILQALTIPVHRTVYNTSTHEPYTLKTIMNSIEKAFGLHPDYVNVSSQFLEEKKITPWMDLPLWVNGQDIMLDNSKVIKDFKMKFTDFDESISRTIDYYNNFQWQEGKAGLRIEKEQELIAGVI